MNWREFKSPGWTLLRGLEAVLLLFLTLPPSIPLITLFVVGVGLVPLAGTGWLLMFASLAITRPLANLYRRWAAGILGVELPPPYRPNPRGGVLPWFQNVITDPATWRDLAWLLLNGIIGFTLVLAQVVLLPFLLVAMWTNPKLRYLHARLTAALLAPSASARLATRVQELSSSRAQTVDASAAELRRIERDLHDGAQARLVSLGMNLGMAEASIEHDPAAARDLLAEARMSTSQALTELRDLVRGIHPPVLADRGLVGGLQALALDCALPVEVDVELAGRPPAPVESAAYFAVAEVLTNAAKHSGAGQVWLHGRHDSGTLRLQITDNGHGGVSTDRGTGLLGIQRRLAAFDGTLMVSSPPGGPTVVSMELPCELSSGKTTPSSETG